MLCETTLFNKIEQGNKRRNSWKLIDFYTIFEEIATVTWSF